jgi:hypothetical protein
MRALKRTLRALKRLWRWLTEPVDDQLGSEAW